MKTINNQAIKIAIVQIYDDNIRQYAEYSRLMNAMYANKHNYTYIGFEYDLVPTYMSVYYNKILAIDAVFKDPRKFDWILYLDSDAIITNFNYKIEDIIARHQDKDIIMAADGNGTNNGVILIKNSKISSSFLQKCFTDKTFFHSETPEQNAMLYYLTHDYSQYLGIEPAWFLNAYLEGYDNNSSSSEIVRFWDKESFILHLMMLPTEDRCEILRQQLMQQGVLCIPKPQRASQIMRK